jgi:pyruvate carboxylase subunit B
MKLNVSIDENSTDVDLNDDLTVATLNENGHDLEIIDHSSERIIVRLNNTLHTVTDYSVSGLDVRFKLNGNTYTYTVKTEQEVMLEAMGFSTHVDTGEGILNAPMPGKILSILVEEGQEVELGQPIAILEAMKMENELKAPVAGKIAVIHVSEEQNVEKNEPLIEIEDLG